MRIVLITFLVAFYLLIYMVTPVVGQSLLADSTSASSISTVTSTNMFSVMFGLFTGGFNPALTQLGVVLWVFNILAVTVFVLALKGA